MEFFKEKAIIAVDFSFNGEKIVNQNTPEKAIIAVDFSKYYFSILTDPEKPKWLTVGMPIRYAERGKDGIFLPEKTRRRKTIAKLFLRLMEEVFETQTISLLHSREIRINGKPIDGYMEIDGKPTVIEFSGCSYHGRDETDITEQTHNGTCHLPKNVIEASDPEHFKNCEICKNAESKDYNFAKPSLWRLRDGETSDSKHFFQGSNLSRNIRRNERKEQQPGKSWI